MKLVRLVASVFLLLLMWQLSVHYLQIPHYILPDPVAVLQALRANALLLLQQTWATTQAAVLGWLCAIICGIGWALLLVTCSWVNFLFLPVLLISQALPIFAIAPLLLMWCGYGLLSKLIIVTIMLFFPITSVFYDGLTAVPKPYLDLAQAMRAQRGAFLFRVRVPLALKALGSGLRVAATFAPMGAILGEWTGATDGLGLLILTTNSQMRLDLMFAAIACLVVLALLFYYLVDFLVTHFITQKFI